MAVTGNLKVNRFYFLADNETSSAQPVPKIILQTITIVFLFLF